MPGVGTSHWDNTRYLWRLIIARSAITLDCASEQGCPFVVCLLFVVCNRFWSVLPLVEVVGSGYCLLVFWQRISFFAVFDQKWTSLKSISRGSAPDWGSQKLFILPKNGPVWNRLAGVQLRIGVPKTVHFGQKRTSLKSIRRGSAPDWGSRKVHLSTSHHLRRFAPLLCRVLCSYGSQNLAPRFCFAKI